MPLLRRNKKQAISPSSFSPPSWPPATSNTVPTNNIVQHHSPGASSNNDRRYYRALHDFAGDVSKMQLIFRASTILIGRPHRVQNGWIWAKPFAPTAGQNASGGWCPLSYLAPVEGGEMPRQQQSPSSAPAVLDAFGAPVEAIPFWVHEGGSTSSAMGGDWTSTKLPGTGDVVQQEVGSQAVRPTPTLDKIGSGFCHAGDAVKSSARNAGSSVRQAAQETRYRMQDMREQRQKQKQQQGPAGMTAQKPPLSDNAQRGVPRSAETTQKRTAGEQRRIDIGNGAARGAVLDGGVTYLLSGGNASRAAHSAKVGAVYGGAHAAVRGWKPFG